MALVRPALALQACSWDVEMQALALVRGSQKGTGWTTNKRAAGASGASSR